MLEGYYKTEDLAALQEARIKTMIPEKATQRNIDKLCRAHRRAVRAARRSTQAKYGRALQRRPGKAVRYRNAQATDGRRNGPELTASLTLAAAANEMVSRYHNQMNRELIAVYVRKVSTTTPSKQARIPVLLAKCWQALSHRS